MGKQDGEMSWIKENSLPLCAIIPLGISFLILLVCSFFVFILKSDIIAKVVLLQGFLFFVACLSMITWDHYDSKKFHAKLKMDNEEFMRIMEEIRSHRGEKK